MSIFLYLNAEIYGPRQIDWHAHVAECSGRGFEDDFNQFHDHEHWPGYTLMVGTVVVCVRVCVCVCMFAGGSVDAILVIKGCSHLQ